MEDNLEHLYTRVSSPPKKKIININLINDNNTLLQIKNKKLEDEIKQLNTTIIYLEYKIKQLNNTTITPTEKKNETNFL